MKARSYNSVGAGEKPKLGVVAVDNPSRPGGVRSFQGVQVSSDIPKVARPGGYGKNMGPSAGSAPKAARPRSVGGALTD